MEYLPGELNLIITVPHNGKEKPEGLEDRFEYSLDGHFPLHDQKYVKHNGPQVLEVFFWPPPLLMKLEVEIFSQYFELF